jgi:hypothetical protein
VLIALIAGLAVLAVVQLTKQPTVKVNPTPTATTAPSPTPALILGPQSCPASVASPAYWQPFITAHDPAGSATVAQVECASVTGLPTLQALVTAERAGQTLDAFVFNDITSASPSVLFQMQGLLKGDAKISAYSTLMTAQVDQHSSVNAGKPIATMTPDLFREFAWSPTKGTMVQTVFPGIFPDLTRYQAEADQVAVNQGHQSWKLSPTSVARAMVTTLLGWPKTAIVSTTLQSGGGPTDVRAIVVVTGKLLGPTVTLNVALARLGDRTPKGIWEVTLVRTSYLTFTSPAPLSLLVSPVKITGIGNAFEGDAGHISLLDHLYTTIGGAGTTGFQGMGHTTFTSTLSFTSTFTAGAQEGVLMINGGVAVTGPVVPVALEKVLIGATK